MEREKKFKSTYKKPSLTLYIEFLDIDIINKFLKNKIYLTNYQEKNNNNNETSNYKT